jgi:hypothetical protein
MNTRIEICIDDPSKCTQQIKLLQDRVEAIIARESEWANYFLSEDEEQQSLIEEELDNFLQNCFLFCQNQQNYLKEIMIILAKLAQISMLEFGRRCFELLVENIRSGKGMGRLAKELLQNYSIPQITCKPKLIDVPTFVMEGIFKSVQERQDPNLIPLSIVKNFAEWMRQLILFYKEKTSMIREDQQQRDVLFIRFVAEMGQYRKFIKAYKQTDIVTNTMILFKLLLKSDLISHQVGIL